MHLPLPTMVATSPSTLKPQLHWVSGHILPIHMVVTNTFPATIPHSLETLAPDSQYSFNLPSYRTRVTSESRRVALTVLWVCPHSTLATHFPRHHPRLCYHRTWFYTYNNSSEISLSEASLPNFDLDHSLLFFHYMCSSPTQRAQSTHSPTLLLEPTPLLIFYFPSLGLTVLHINKFPHPYILPSLWPSRTPTRHGSNHLPAHGNIWADQPAQEWSCCHL